MDQVDQAIVNQLRDIGCAIEDKTRNIQGLTKNEILECVSECLRHINPDNLIKFPKIYIRNLNMASKFRLASNLSAACNSIGYKVKLEYQTFFYGSVTDIRNLFLFLTERVCREDTGQSVEYNEQDIDTLSDYLYGNISVLSRKFKFDNCHETNPILCEKHISCSRKTIKCHWQPRSIDLVSLSRETNARVSEAASAEASSYKKPPVAPRKQNVQVDVNFNGIGHMLSLIEWNQLNLQDGSYQNLIISNESEEFKDKYSRMIDHDSLLIAQQDEKFMIEQQDNINDKININCYKTSDDDSIVRNERNLDLSVEKYIDCRKSLLSELTTELDCLDSEHKLLHDDEKVLFSLEEEIRQCKKEQNDLKLALKTVDILEHDIKMVENDLVKYKSNWAEVKSILREEILSLNSDISMISNSESVSLCNNIQNINKKIETSKTKIKKNFIAIENLNARVALFKKQRNDLLRSSYIKMLTEVTKQLKKQIDDLNKVLLEVKGLQKEINSLNGRLQRSFALVDEALFEGSKNDEWNRKCYKLLAAMHEECDILIQGVECCGEVRRDVLKLEEMVDTEKSKKIDESLSRVAFDLQIVKDDNKAHKDIK